MPDFRYVTTVANGPDSYMTGLGDLLIHETDAGLWLFGASGRDGGVLAREVDAGLRVRDVETYTSSAGLDAPRELQVVDLNGDPTLLAIGRYGTMIEGWQVTPGGLLGASRPLTLEGGSPGALLALDQTWLNGQHLFVTSSRHEPGVQVWARAGDSLYSVAQSGTSTFLAPGAVQALSVVQAGSETHVLALDVLAHTLTGFVLGPGGQLGTPNRLDLRDGLFIGTPTHLEAVQMGDAGFAILGAAGSSSITVVALAPDGRMWVTDQVNDTDQTRFQGLMALDVLQANDQVYVLSGGVDNGLSLMMLTPGGRLIHLASLTDEQREMALQGLSDVEMTWRAGGLDIFVSGEVLQGETVAGHGITQLRVEGEGLVPNLHLPAQGRVQTGTDAADLFILDGAGAGDQVIGFEPGRDRLDLSGMGRFYSVDDLQIQSTSTGAVIRLGEAQVTITTADGSRLRADDFGFADLSDLWHISVSPPAPAQQMAMVLGSDGSDLLDGRSGDDVLLGEPRALPFDDASAQVFRLYQATLDRSPDLRGLMNWSARLQDGEMTLPQVAAGFTNSVEFRQTYGMTDNRAFVTLLYDNVLDRAPDEQGLANWTGRLDRGEMDRSQVVTGFSESAEFRDQTAAEALSFSRAGLQAGFSDDVYRLYQATLGREPDPGGFTNWTARLAEGVPFGTVVGGFTNSAEFRQAFGVTDNRAFVTLLYDNVLNRAPDPQGLANWAGRLDRGEMDRSQVVMGFSQSAEFVRASAPDLKTWMLAQGTDDILDGDGGDNILMGGLLSDTFVFRQDTGGSHVVVDPEPWDRLDFKGFGYERHAALDPHLTRDGADTVFADQGVTIRFMDSTTADIRALEIDF